MRLANTMNSVDSATRTRKAKPLAVPCAEIGVNTLPVGQPTPTDPASFTFVAHDTRTPYTLDFAGADGGKNANCLLRWVNPTGEKGPWSETATATIGA